MIEMIYIKGIGINILDLKAIIKAFKPNEYQIRRRCGINNEEFTMEKMKEIIGDFEKIEKYCDNIINNTANIDSSKEFTQRLRKIDPSNKVMVSEIVKVEEGF